MKTYEIINPSDAVTVQSETDKHAAAAVLLLGAGWFGLTDEDGNSIEGAMCPFLKSMNDVDGIYQIAYNDTFTRIVTEDVFMLCDVLDSAATISMNERKMYDLALSKITEEDARQEFIAEWDNKNRSSLNDIANKARKLSKRMREKHCAEVGNAAPIVALGMR